LKRVSRSFYLSVAVLPAPVQEQVAIGYLLARAADTLADTALLPAGERRQLLGTLRLAVRGDEASRNQLISRLRAQQASGSAGAVPPGSAVEAELVLLGTLDECLACFEQQSAADQALIGRVLDQLIYGMERDLDRFPAVDSVGGEVPPSAVVALATQSELDEYTYYAAGCVGEFWTDLMAAHLPPGRALGSAELRQRGVALGKALQLVNVVRDAPADLRAGRCYWPRELLVQHGLSAERLAELATARAAALPTLAEENAIRLVTAHLIHWGHELCAAAWPYVQAIPARELRLRLACTWPLFLALDTLRALRSAGSPLLPPMRAVKVSRQKVYGMLLRSGAAALADLPAGSRHLDQLFLAASTDQAVPIPMASFF
jgi:farnesyl-diphosphate farnesyltransferase